MVTSWLKERPLLNDMLVSLLAVFAAFVVGAGLLVLAGADPLVAYRPLLLGAFSSRYGLTETLVKATPLLLVGLGIAVAFRGGILNIGAEGQLILGTIATTWVVLAFKGLPGPLLLLLALAAGFLGGALWGAVPGVLKAKIGANEILITIMMNQIAALLLGFLIRGPMIDAEEVAYGTGYPQSALIPEGSWLLRLPQTRLHAGLLLALLAAFLVYVFLWRTTLGYQIRVVGTNPQAARYGGISVARNLIIATCISSGLAGLAGMIEVTGVHHRLLDGISAGYGFTAIVVALFGKLHPLGIIPASFLFGALLVGADMMQRTVGIPAGLVNSIQGLVVVFVVSTEIWQQRRA